MQTVKTVSDWQLLKLNAPEWPLITVGSIAAFLQGACFPVFALLFGFSSGVRFSNKFVTLTIFLGLLLRAFEKYLDVSMILTSLRFFLPF